MTRPTTWRALLVLLAAVAFLAAACGDDGDEEADETATTAAAAETDEADGGDAAEDAGSGVAITLNDSFEIVGADGLSAGSVTFNVSNDGPDFPHALTIVRADSVDDLTYLDTNGAVDMDAIDAADIIGSTSVPMDAGTAEDLTVDLEAGNYVFFCPIQNDTQSHVGAGQIVAVSVG